MSATGDALEALYALLVALHEAQPSVIPEPLQNEDLPARLVDMGSGLQMLLNVWDDSDDEPEELLGADVTADSFEHQKDVPVEFVVAGGANKAARRTKFEAGLAAMFDAIAADPTLGGVVDNARMLTPRRSGSGLVVDGLPNILAADFRVRLLFTSSRTF